MLSTTLMIVGIAAALILAVRLIGPARVWRIYGRPDLGPVDFATLERRSTPNDALACPPGLCVTRVDMTVPVYAVPARDLRAALARALADEPRLEKVAVDDAVLTERWVQRSALLGHPDTIVVRFIELPDGRSTLALYSRSQIRRTDFGVNRARLARWMQKLAQEVPPAG